MKFLILIILLLLKFTVLNLFSSELTNIDRSLCKLIIDWGYLENYHPLLISNKIDADSLFCQFSNDIINKKTSYSAENLLNFLNTKVFLPVSNNILFYKSLCEEKTNLANSKSLTFADSIIPNKRVLYNESTNQLEFNTSVDLSQPFPPASLRILGLAKIWNNYKFYYPYQEILPHNKAYNDLLMKYIRIILDCNNFTEYHLAILEFTCEYRDSHSSASSFIIKNHFGKKTIPAKVRYLDGKVVIYDYYEKSILDNTPLRIGDIILQVNDEGISNIFRRLKSYISYSNSESMYRNLSNLCIKTNQDSLRLQIMRNGICFSITLPTYNFQDLLVREEHAKKNNSIVKLNDSILYIHCKYVDTSDLRNILIQDHLLKWFIFDLRSSTTWIKPIIEDFFFQTKRIFAIYYTPLPSKPGHFSDPKSLTIGPSKPEFQIKNPHAIILVNENTQSQGEFQTMILQAIPKAITIGSRTAGTDGNISKFIIPGNISITMTSLGIQYPNRKKTQRNGVKIDYYSSPKLKYAKQGIDQELNFALEFIKKGG